MKKKVILILGSDGMVGDSLYRYFEKNNNYRVYGSSRNKENVEKLYLEAETFDKDLKKIFLKLKKIDFVINCIAILKETGSKKNFKFVNASFPHLLHDSLKSNNTKVIQISSDAVFSKLSGMVNELSKPLPDTDYGRVKLLGELTHPNALTIRSSFLGLDPIKKRGLLEKIKNKKGILKLSNNYLWTGSTTIQFAKFCDYVINNFNALREKSPIFHFTPLGPLSRCELGKIIVKTLNVSDLEIKPSKFPFASRYLYSKYSKELKIKQYENDLSKALLMMEEDSILT